MPYLAEEARVLAEYLIHEQRPPTEFERYRIRHRYRLTGAARASGESRFSRKELPAVAVEIPVSVDVTMSGGAVGPSALVRLADLGSGPALLQAIHRGRLRARKIGKDWYSTREWVAEYLKSKGEVYRKAAIRRAKKRRRGKLARTGSSGSAKRRSGEKGKRTLD